MRLLGYIGWLLRALLFVALLLFALRNTDPVVVRLYLDRTWEGPLVLAALAFFALGAALGVVACLGRLFAQRREIMALKKELRARPTDVAPLPPPPPDAGL